MGTLEFINMNLLPNTLIAVGLIHSSCSVPINDPKTKSSNADQCEDPCWHDAYDRPIRYAIEMNEHVPDWLTRDRFRTVMKEAFNAWTSEADLRFMEVTNPRKSDIKVSFEPTVHGDGYPFPGGTLGHAFYPSPSGQRYTGNPDYGDIHFYKDKEWVLGQDSTGYDLLRAAVHNVGHSLGLSHSSNRNSIMYPVHVSTPWTPGTRLRAVDVRAIRVKYG